MAASQGFSYILDEGTFIPKTEDEEITYKEDSGFIYQAFQMCWAESLNFYLVEQNKKEKDGRQVYLDAKKYFRGEAVEDAILNETVAELVTSKLTPNTFNGAEGYNNKFNDNKNQLVQLGYDLPEKIIKSLYLSNIMDKIYDTIKDQPSIAQLTLQDLQSNILKKYMATSGDRRPQAPRYSPKMICQQFDHGYG